MLFNTHSKKSIENVSNQKITTLIGEDCVIEGVLRSSNFVKIDGKVLNNIEVTSGVIIGEKSEIKGDISTQELIVFGKVEGNIQSKSLVLKNTARVTGTIVTETFSVESGAKYTGNVAMKFNTTQVPAPENKPAK